MAAYRKPLQERSRRTFDALLDAAGVLLGECGIERISTNMICERAGVTPPAFYRYFDDKYAIVEALAERLMEKQNVALETWVARYRDAGLAVIAEKVIDLIREMDRITGGQPGALWIMRALRAVPSLTHIRLFSHNYVADLLADIYAPYLPHVSRDVIRRRTRMSVEMAYSLDEMLKEEEADRESLFADAHHVFKAMFHYPDYLARET
ncbi:TetR/AcrR family transcriptional regulator [Sphingobium aquiterrae]|uniref:TetR/AcrR family transcriptional regulator n=1 Tax=Sphingobium aquiterrae TaxID=2038656 RepID=UPI0030164108